MTDEGQTPPAPSDWCIECRNRPRPLTSGERCSTCAKVGPTERGNTSALERIEHDALTRDMKAIELRKQGKSFQFISDELSYGGRGNAHRAVMRRMRVVREECKDSAAELKQLELERLDAMLEGVWPKATAGDVQAIDRVIRIMERRSAYEGLDEPRGLKVELHRALDGFLERVRQKMTPEVYEQLMALVADEDLGPPSPDGDSGGQGSEGAGARGGDAEGDTET